MKVYLGTNETYSILVSSALKDAAQSVQNFQAEIITIKVVAYFLLERLTRFKIHFFHYI